MHLDRRDFLAAGLGTSLFYPLQACAAQGSGPQFTPEAYGAIGDGRRDDYDALLRMAKAVNAARRGTVTLAPGKTYLVDRFDSAAGRLERIEFVGCDGLTVAGNGATIAVKGSFNRGQREVRGLPGLMFRDCRNVALRNLQLDGNVQQMTRAPKLGEVPSHGLLFRGCFDVLIDGVQARRFPSDGLYIAESGGEPGGGRRGGPGAEGGPEGGPEGGAGPRVIGTVSRRFTVRNSAFLFNARQGLSIIHLRGGQFDNCDFSHTGYIAPGVRAPYGSHSPAAGVDVEPNGALATRKSVDSLTGDIVFANCRMVGNYGASFTAAKYNKGQRFMERIALRGCTLICASDPQTSRYGFIFDVPDGEVSGCTLQLYHKTAFLGWYAESDASFRFTGNTVSGDNPTRGQPLIQVRATRGVPTIERNRLIAPGAPAFGRAAEQMLINVANPNAIVRDNQQSVAPPSFLG